MEEKEVKDVNETEETVDEAENKAAEETVEADQAEEVTEEATEDASQDSDKKKSFFKKDKKKDKKDEKIEELNDQLMRRMAEFDNFRKRTEKEKTQMFEMGAKSIIEKMLPVIDNFERGLGALSEEEKDSAFAKGIEAIYKQLVSSLEEVGVKQIEAVGKDFDPNFHNAVMHAEDEELGENVISEEFQKGYMYHDSVVRHSMVKVVN